MVYGKMERSFYRTVLWLRADYVEDLPHDHQEYSNMMTEKSVCLQGRQEWHRRALEIPFNQGHMQHQQCESRDRQAAKTNLLYRGHYREVIEYIANRA